MKPKLRIFSSDFIFILLALSAMSVIAFFNGTAAGFIVLSAALLFALLYLNFVLLRRIRWQRFMVKLLSSQDEPSASLNLMSLPTALTTLSGYIKWANLAFRNIAGFGALRNINSMIKNISVPDKDKKIKIGNKTYVKELRTVWYKRRELLLYRLVDMENTVEAKKLYQSFLPVVCHVLIDNYEELSSQFAQSELSEIVAAVERRIASMAKNTSGFFARTDRGRYLCVFERRFLSILRSDKFSILEDVRHIGAPISPTLSIAAGVGESAEQSGEFAGKALELCLGRGGDQAVIKQGDNYVFFGGTTKAGLRRSKVKARMISHAFRNLLEQCGDVYIMGHDVPDLDCIGAALGICACARHIGKKYYIVMENPNPSIELLLNLLRGTDEYAHSLVTGQEAALHISPASMLVVLDTQISDFTISPGLLEMADTVVVIDHHIRGTSNIEKAALYYHDPNASSACELVTEIMQYFDDDLKPLPVDLDALLSGITLDTKGFSFNTGVRTFEAASYLRRRGADLTVSRQLMQDDLETYMAKTDIVRNAQILPGGIAVSLCPEGLSKTSLIAAQAADALLTIRGVAASFVVCRADETTLISGRSQGDVNVQLILESLGGGGHATIAAARFSDTDLETAVKKLKTAIKKYVKEVD
ncbi:MAG: DHH family phosphoesterase [Christensenellales bacterium]